MPHIIGGSEKPFRTGEYREGTRMTDELYIKSGYRLVEAIIQQAAYDYRQARKHIRRNKGADDCRAARGTCREAERFFTGLWFQDLCPILDGEEIFRNLKYEEDKKDERPKAHFHRTNKTRHDYNSRKGL